MVLPFEQLPQEHRREVSAQIHPEGTMWALYTEFPVDLLVQHARITGKLDRKKIEAVKKWMKKRDPEIRRVLVDSSEEFPWIEGFHRTMAAKELGLETIPVWLRVK